MRKIINIIVTVMILSVAAQAGKVNKWGTGGPTGNYFTMTNEILDPEICGAIPGAKPNEVINTEGSADNIFGATQNKYKIFWTSADALLESPSLTALYLCAKTTL